MSTTKIDHVAYITPDMGKTIRFYRDLLGMKLEAGFGYEGYRHYFFQIGDSYIAFIQYEEAKPMEYNKFHGDRTDLPIGFDHISFTVDSKESLFEIKDKLDAANIEVHGVIDHGLVWSIYFFDPVSNLPLELTWNFFEFTEAPVLFEREPLKIAEEGAYPQSGHWPEVTNPTPPEEMTASSSDDLMLRETMIKSGKGKVTEQGKASGISL